MIARKKRTAKRQYVAPLVFACCLLLAGICSAKMINSNPVEKDSEAHVAGWSVDVTSSDSGSMTLDAGANSQSYSLTVTNSSDVASTYGIKVSNIPAGVKIGLDAASDADLATPVNGEIIFTNTGGDLDYNAPDNTRTHALTLTAEATANITQSSVDMAIEVLFTQKEPQP